MTEYFLAAYEGIRALRSGWKLRDLRGTLRGPIRDFKGNVLSWCHFCNQGIYEGEGIYAPPEKLGWDGPYVAVEVCPRCLRGPTDDNENT